MYYGGWTVLEEILIFFGNTTQITYILFSISKETLSLHCMCLAPSQQCTCQPANNKVCTYSIEAWTRTQYNKVNKTAARTHTGREVINGTKGKKPGHDGTRCEAYKTFNFHRRLQVLCHQ